MQRRSYPVCPHCGSTEIVERGVIGWFNFDVQVWTYGAGDDSIFECDDCGEEFQEPREIAVPVAQREIDDLRREMKALRLAGDDGASRALSVESDAAVAHNHKALRDRDWLSACGKTARAA